ncbi:MAG: Aha1 domain protein [Hyphomicrobiales bacterium]|jgi:uncharacterized protein YndB with AHSA1/START domain|nr:Aha1 domain protein [Hyphomicrobiales bacterium]
MPDIMHLLAVKAPADKVYDAITTPDGVRNWWTRTADLATKVGGTGAFRFPHYGPSSETQVRIDDLQRPARVAWSVLSSFHPEWRDTTIAFDMAENGDATRIAFAHRGFKEANEAYALFTTGWAYYLVSLKRYVEIGEGGPNPDVDFIRIFENTRSMA